MSTEINMIPAGQRCYVEGRQNTSLSIWRDFRCCCGVGEPIMLYKNNASTWESQHSPTEKTAGMPYKRKGGKQKNVFVFALHGPVYAHLSMAAYLPCLPGSPSCGLNFFRSACPQLGYQITCPCLPSEILAADGSQDDIRIDHFLLHLAPQCQCIGHQVVHQAGTPLGMAVDSRRCRLIDDGGAPLHRRSCGGRTAPLPSLRGRKSFSVR